MFPTPSKDDKKLAELTNGKITSISSLDEILIEQILKQKIEHGNKAPLFNRTGAPLLNSDGTPKSISYTHASAFVNYLFEQAEISPKTAEDIEDIPVPYWMPTDVVLISKDGDALFTTRSNFTKNAVGISLTASAGFPQLQPDGTPENIIDCGIRELKEELDLDLNDIADQVIELPLICDQPIQRFPVKTDNGNILGCVPTSTATIAVQSKLSTQELMDKIQIGNEAIGIVVLPQKTLENLTHTALARKTVCEDVEFHPSPFFERFLKTPPSAIEKLEQARDILLSPETEKMTEESISKAPLLEAIRIKVSADDFMYNGNIKALDKTLSAVQRFSQNHTYQPTSPTTNIDYN